MQSCRLVLSEDEQIPDLEVRSRQLYSLPIQMVVFISKRKFKRKFKRKRKGSFELEGVRIEG